MYHLIQNKIIELCGNPIQNTIIQKLRSAEWFSVIFDETADVSNTEQVSILVGYSLREDFLRCFHHWHYRGGFNQGLIGQTDGTVSKIQRTWWNRAMMVLATSVARCEVCRLKSDSSILLLPMCTAESPFLANPSSSQLTWYSPRYCGFPIWLPQYVYTETNVYKNSQTLAGPSMMHAFPLLLKIMRADLWP